MVGVHDGFHGLRICEGCRIVVLEHCDCSDASMSMFFSGWCPACSAFAALDAKLAPEDAPTLEDAVKIGTQRRSIHPSMHFQIGPEVSTEAVVAATPVARSRLVKSTPPPPGNGTKHETGPIPPVTINGMTLEPDEAELVVDLWRAVRKSRRQPSAS